MASSSKNFHARSNSLSCRSHPCTLRVDEELNKLRVLEASTASTSESIYTGLSGLEDLYVCVQHFLNLASTQKVLSQRGHEKVIEKLLDGSVKILDVCEVTKDLLVHLKEQSKSLQSALRRRKVDSSIQSCISSFITFRKSIKKDVKKLATTLKQVDNKCQDSEALPEIEALREVSFISVSILESLLGFLSVKPKSSKWSLVSKLMHKEKVACAGTNELVDADAALFRLCKSEANYEKTQTAQDNLEALVMSIQGFEDSLDGAFRHLIRVRSSILNIVSL